MLLYSLLYFTIYWNAIINNGKKIGKKSVLFCTVDDYFMTEGNLQQRWYHVIHVHGMIREIMMDTMMIVRPVIDMIIREK